ncbi:MAG TPA: hypothetical protein VNJ07_11165 [Chitinophagales bacterium]|nr:hypothetical protein [Chitinophagales bacterium]
MVAIPTNSSSASERRFYFIFLIKVFLIYLTWRLFEFIIGIESEPLENRMFPQLSYYWEWLNNQLRIGLIYVTRLILSVFGYESEITNNYVLTVTGYRGIAIGNYCLAFQFMFFYSSLVFISPVPARVKLWSIPAGCLMIQALNVFRFVGLHLVIIHLSGWENKMHDYFFNGAALILTLLMYMKLLSRYG